MEHEEEAAAAAAEAEAQGYYVRRHYILYSS